MAIKLLKTLSKSFIIRKMQIKMTMTAIIHLTEEQITNNAFIFPPQNQENHMGSPFTSSQNILSSQIKAFAIARD